MNFYSSNKDFVVDSNEFDTKLPFLEQSGIRIENIKVQGNSTSFTLVDTPFFFGCPLEFIAKVFNLPLKMFIEM